VKICADQVNGPDPLNTAVVSALSGKNQIQPTTRSSRPRVVTWVTRSHLRRLFHASFNCSPKAVLDRVRLQKAANLLSSSTHTLKTIAAASGFRDATELCRFFRRHFKSSPDMGRRTVGVLKPDLIPPSQKARTADAPRRRRLP
jgi:AraC-like DNA-binding protein